MDPITAFCGSWTFMPDFVLAHKQLTAYDKLVYCGIARRTRLADDRPEAWPGLEDIAKHTGVSRKAVYNSVKKLVAQGLIQKTHQHKPDGGLTSNRYTLIPVAERANAAPPPQCRPPVSDVHHPHVPGTPEADTLKQIEEEGARSKTRSHQPRPAERAEAPLKRQDSQGEERPGAGNKPRTSSRRTCVDQPTAPGLPPDHSGPDGALTTPPCPLTRRRVMYEGDLPPDDPGPVPEERTVGFEVVRGEFQVNKPRSPKVGISEWQPRLGQRVRITGRGDDWDGRTGRVETNGEVAGAPYYGLLLDVPGSHQEARAGFYAKHLKLVPPKRSRSPKQKVGDAEIALGNLLAERWESDVKPACGLPGASTRSVASMRKAGKAVKALKDIAPELLEDEDKLVNRIVTEIARTNGKIQGLCFDMLFPGGNLVKLINGNFRQREEETHFKVPGKEQ